MLEFGQNYTLVLVLTNRIGEICNFYYNFTVNHPPLAYGLNLNPSFGIENKQTFTMTVTNPISISNNYPLKYSFGYISNSEKVYLSSYTPNPKFSFVLGYIQQTVSLFVVIFDTLGDTTQFNTTLSLQLDPLFDSSSYFNQEIQSNYVFNPEQPLKIVNLINLIVLRDYNSNGNYSP